MTKLQEDQEIKTTNEYGEQVVSSGTRNGQKTLTLHMICDLSRDKMNEPKATREHFKSNFDFIDELFTAICNYQQEETMLINSSESKKDLSANLTIEKLNLSQNASTMNFQSNSVKLVKRRKNENQLYYNAQKTSIGVQVFVRQNTNPFLDEQFAYGSPVFAENHAQENRLSKWATDFHREVVMEKLHSQKKHLFVKYFELRPYSYGII